jgi:predicted NUDIX family NTP pyrophosphohydrolase
MLLTTPVLADSYSSGYDAGYYTGFVASDATSYGRGVNDGAYDADEDDAAARQRSEEFEAGISVYGKEPDATVYGDKQ